MFDMIDKSMITMENSYDRKQFLTLLREPFDLVLNSVPRKSSYEQNLKLNSVQSTFISFNNCSASCLLSHVFAKAENVYSSGDKHSSRIKSSTC